MLSKDNKHDLLVNINGFMINLSGLKVTPKTFVSFSTLKRFNLRLNFVGIGKT